MYERKAAKRKRDEPVTLEPRKRVASERIKTKSTFTIPLFGPAHQKDHILRHGQIEQRPSHLVTAQPFNSKGEHEAYLRNTGLESINPKGTRQRSRRGSIGDVRVENGVFHTVRVSSLATSQALLTKTPEDAWGAFKAQANKITEPITNRAKTPQSANAALIEALELDYKTGTGWQLTSGKFAQGVSGGALAKLPAEQQKNLYAPGYRTAESLGLTAKPEWQHHSEVMALGLMGSLRNHAVVMGTSNRNDMCVNCGRTFGLQLTDKHIASITGGVPFQHQKEGRDLFTRKNDSEALRKGAWVHRSAPITQQLGAGASLNKKEIEALHKTNRTVLNIQRKAE
ncbi:hypothetical protein ACFJGW_18060 [Burkholderiaceae bacterium UC74_6]